MDLSSRWDRFAGIFILLLAVISMAGCLALSTSKTAAAGGSVSAANMNLDFGTAVVGTTIEATDVLSNGSSETVTIASVTSSNPTFQLMSPATPFTLSSGQTASLAIAFSPHSAGKPAGKISVNTSGGGKIDIAVTGNAVTAGTMALSPGSLTFGNVAVGQSEAKAVTLSNSGGTSVTVSQASVTNGAFAISGLTLPLTIDAGQSAAFNVIFAPKSGGVVNANVTINGVSSLTVKAKKASAGAKDTAPASAALSVSGDGIAPGQLVATPASVSFGNVSTGSTQNQAVTLTNGGSTSVTISQVAASGSSFSLSGITTPLTLGAGLSTTFTATFTPSAAGAATGNVAVTSTATNPSLNIGLSGTGVTAASMAASPASIGFGSVQVGSTQSQTERLTNSGGSPLHIATATVTGAGFATTGLSVPTTLNAGQSLTFSVTFTPSSGGAVNGSLALTADGSVPSLSVALSGTGTTPGQLSVNPATANFGSVTVGATQSQSGSLTASGASVTVSAVSSSNPEFRLTGLSLPVTLAAGQSAPFTLTFAPQASGAASATVTFSSNATNPPVTASLTGTGTPAPQHTVSLSWTASTSTVVGYNVYRGTQSGGPYAAVNSTPDATTSYTDSTVQAGQTYYYVVTAVDSSGNESVNSNQAQAVVPTP